MFRFLSQFMPLSLLFLTGSLFAEGSSLADGSPLSKGAIEAHGSALTDTAVKAGTAVSATGQILNIAGMLAVVLVLIVAMAWVARRLMTGNLKVGRHIKLLEVFPLGRNEKLCLTRVGSKTLLLGVSTQGIRKLECWDDWPEEGEVPESGEFQKILSRLVKSS